MHTYVCISWVSECAGSEAHSSILSTSQQSQSAKFHHRPNWQLENVSTSLHIWLTSQWLCEGVIFKCSSSKRSVGCLRNKLNICIFWYESMNNYIHTHVGIQMYLSLLYRFVSVKILHVNDRLNVSFCWQLRLHWAITAMTLHFLWFFAFEYLQLFIFTRMYLDQRCTAYEWMHRVWMNMCTCYLYGENV